MSQLVPRHKRPQNPIDNDWSRDPDEERDSLEHCQGHRASAAAVGL